MIVLRLWHYKLLPYLPELQFKGQWRELVLVLNDWKYRGKTNHLLINRVMDYPKNDLFNYYLKYAHEYHKRYNKLNVSAKFDEFASFAEDHTTHIDVFKGWHDKDYLRVCVANLYEKYYYGVGKSKISQQEWDRVLLGYKKITGEDYKI